MKISSINWMLTLAAAAALAACGGGGGGGGGASVSPAPGPVVPGPAPVFPSVALITSPILPSGVIDAEETAAYTRLNAERSRCGFGQLNWNNIVATAARSHADWQLINHYLSHAELAGTPGFTGVNAFARITAAGLTNFTSTDEISDHSGTNDKTGQGPFLVNGLLSAPYHSLGLLRGFTEAGFSLRNATDAGSTHGARVVLQVNLTHNNTTGPQRPTGMANNEVRTYPCAGTTGTLRQLDHEEPNPIPGRNLAINPIGHPIMVTSPIAFATLVITSASITPTAGGAALALLPTLTSLNDANNIIASNEAVLMPNLPLTALTSYTVVVNGTVNGNAFTSTFAWTTGN